MKTQTKKVYLLAILRGGSNTISYGVSDSKMETIPDYTVISEQTVCFDVPEQNDINASVVSCLEEKRDELRAVASAAITEVDNQIASLLALEHIDVPE